MNLELSMIMPIGNADNFTCQFLQIYVIILKTDDKTTETSIACCQLFLVNQLMKWSLDSLVYFYWLIRVYF